MHPLNYDHIGIPTKTRKEGMIYFPEYKVWTNDYEKTPYRIEWLFCEKGSPLHPLIQNSPHIAFLVDDIHKAVKGKKILMEPIQYQNYWMAFIEEDGVPVEFIQPP